MSAAKVDAVCTDKKDATAFLFKKNAVVVKAAAIEVKKDAVVRKAATEQKAAEKPKSKKIAKKKKVLKTAEEKKQTPAK